MKTKSKLFLLSTVILFFLLLWGVKVFQEDDAAIHIAFVGPMSGDSAMVGKSMTQAIQLYLDTINEQGGVNSKKVILDIFDDQNDPNKASKVAQEIVAQDRAIAVIGHNCSACSIKAGQIYQKAGIPAITPVSTHVDVTQNNEWYFRTVFNDRLQARFLVNYAKRLLQQNTVSIIYTDVTYASDLASLFEKASQELIDIPYKWLLSSDKDLEAQMAQIVSDLQTKPNAGLIFLATHAPEGVKLVKLIRDAGIKNTLMAPDAYASSRFSEALLNFQKEKQTPGYYTHDLYISTPFLFDMANRQAHYFNALYQEKYQEKLPPWHAFYAVDAAIVLVEAIKRSNIPAQQDTLVVDRNTIRETFSNHFNTPQEALEGNTGLNYFDNKGDAFKSVFMGVYKNNRLISAFKQLQIPTPSQEMYQTDVVYTGIQLNNISHFNPKTATYTLDFYIWFRFQGDIPLQQIEFINAVEPIRLDTPLIKETIGKENYRLYRVKGEFKEKVSRFQETPFVIYSPKHNLSLTQHLLEINFRHRDLDRNHFIYVTDILGMELTKKTSLLEKTKEIQAQNALENWTVEEINFFQGKVKHKLLGNPKYFMPGNTLEYSTFNADIWISNNAYTYYTLIPFQFVSGFFVFSGVMTLLLIFVSYQDNKASRLKYLWFFQIIFTFLLLITTELFVMHWIIEHFRTVPIETIITVFKVLWWLISAILLKMAVERFFWLPLEEKTERTVPNLMRFLTALLIYTLTLFAIMAFVFERPITSLLATSGVLAMIIGLAIQMNLSNIFSGIALNAERSFRIGDWVKIGSFDEGKIFNMNWRVTQIETRRGYILSIPNSTVSNSDIHNFSYPDAQYWLLCRVPIDIKHDPRKVEEILAKAILSVKQDVVKDFKPSIWIDNLQAENVNNWVANYLIFFKTENYQHKFRVLKNVWQSIWSHLNQAGIMPILIEPLSSQEEQNTIALPSEVAKVLNKSQLQNMVGST